MVGNGVPGVPGVGIGVTSTGGGLTGVPGIGNGFAGGGPGGLGGPGLGVPPGADGDSSGDSDSTVVEEGPGEAPPEPPQPRGVPPAVPSDVPSDVPKGGPGDWEQERQTLRALQELGGPPESPPAGALPRLAVRELLFWRDVRRSAVAFGASLVLLLSLATLSAVTVVAHVALALLCVTISLRVYKAVVQALQKSEEGHPFRAYLELDVTLSPERFQAQAAAVALHVNRALRLLLRLFLVEDLVDSLELALTMWLLTYVGAVFNGITLLILADLLAFTLPPLYEKYKVQIDHYVGIVRSQTKDIVAKIQAKLPGLAKKKPE
ncbi:reticulon-3 isoform X1 [Myiozetetes cayanensis]|uniref:reticulon-3 isoform X1 n=1 Tax=Myiozetetes cayanensis TaxID=478635 RepID=UPI00215F101C|nr:reticulon-3 isoform X1 [Myiozetetes cayanensis]